MRRKDLQKREKLLFKQLEVMNLLKEEFYDKLGKAGYEERINNILDEINLVRKLLREMGDKY